MYLIYFAFLTEQYLIQIPSCHLHVSPLVSIFNVHFLPPKKETLSFLQVISEWGVGWSCITGRGGRQGGGRG